MTTITQPTRFLTRADVEVISRKHSPNRDGIWWHIRVGDTDYLVSGTRSVYGDETMVFAATPNGELADDRYTAIVTVGTFDHEGAIARLLEHLDDEDIYRRRQVAAGLRQLAELIATTDLPIPPAGHGLAITHVAHIGDSAAVGLAAREMGVDVDNGHGWAHKAHRDFDGEVSYTVYSQNDHKVAPAVRS